MVDLVDPVEEIVSSIFVERTPKDIYDDYNTVIGILNIASDLLDGINTVHAKKMRKYCSYQTYLLANEASRYGNF